MKTEEYFQNSPPANKIGMILASSVKDAIAQEHMNAFIKANQTYLLASCYELDLERITSLAYAGNYALRNNHPTHAVLFLEAAYDCCDSSSGFPAELKTPLALDAGNAGRYYADNMYRPRPTKSHVPEMPSTFREAIAIANNTGDIARKFFALCGHAGVSYALQDYGPCEVDLEEATSF